MHIILKFKPDFKSEEYKQRSSFGGVPRGK